MEIGEAIAVFDASLKDKDENYCGGETHETPQTGPNLIDGFTGTPTPENLLKSMKKHNDRDGSPHIPKLPPKKDSSDHWDIGMCDGDMFPYQTHHLIPKKFLPKQPVSVWLTEKYTKNQSYQLAKDTRYSTDHSNNGYCLPFVSTCYAWKNAKNEHEKAAVANEMMFRTNRQLHQGNHNTQDFGEEDAIELEGYLDSIGALLARIHESAMDHIDRCNFCKKDGGGKVTVQPLHRIVDQVDAVSLITRLRIDANQIFVSQRAYDYFRLRR